MNFSRTNLGMVKVQEEQWQNPTTGVITSSFGKRMNPVLKKEEFHNGIDIAVPIGTELVAMKSGVVKEVSTSPTFGNLIKYETNQGEVVMYAHLEKSFVKKGDAIEQGQIIARSGNSGLSTGPHVHVSIWEKDQLADPFYVVTLPYTDEVKVEMVQRGVVLR